MTNANNTEDFAGNGRRSTDNKPPETAFSPSASNFRSRLLIGFISLGGITALLGIGRASNTLDTAVKDIDHNKVAIREILDQNRDLIIVLKEQNIQQKESDKRFEGKFDRVIDKLKDVDDSVRDNKNDIIIMQQKISMRDNTGVYLAMR
jgi:hypothetical protein